MLKKIFKSYKTLEEKKQRNRELKLLLLSGVLLGISFPPIPLPYFLFVALIPFLMVLEKRQSLASINRATYFTTFIFNLITLYWVGSWTKDADPFLMISGTVLLFFNPITFLIPSTLYYYAKKYISKKYAIYLLPWFWLFYEYIYSITDFKFPWLTFANGLPYFLSYIQIAEIIGAFGLTLFVVYSNIFAYKFVFNSLSSQEVKYSYFALFLFVVIAPILYGVNKLNISEDNNSKLKVGLIQPNLNPNKKWEIGNLNVQIDLYEKLSKKAIEQGAELIIWPETALPVYLLTNRYADKVQRIQTFVDTNNIPLITGMPHAEYYSIDNAPPDAKLLSNKQGAYTSYNSILFFSPHKDVEQYGKIKLVPFGEKVPLVDIFPVVGKWIKWNVGISSWNTGQDTVVFKYQNNSTSLNIGGIICIESIYPDFVASFVEKGAQFIAVVTNDSWYGNSSGPYQHKEISVLRAIENRRYVVRAANGGISCIIDNYGRTIDSSKMFTQDVVVGNVILESKLTFFSRYPLIFPFLSIIVSVICLFISVVNKWRKNK